MPKKKSTASPKSRDWSHFLIENTPGAVITADQEGQITEFNPAAQRLTGYSRSEAMGRIGRGSPELSGGRDAFPLEPGVAGSA